MADQGHDGAGPPLIEAGLLQDILGSALRTGGEFAEVFVEDRRSTSAILDDGRVEELTSGRDRGAGIRVVVGETTGFAHTADVTPAGLRSAAEAAAAGARGTGGGGGLFQALGEWDADGWHYCADAAAGVPTALAKQRSPRGVVQAPQQHSARNSAT
mgnify:CR=1 FL=1